MGLAKKRAMRRAGRGPSKQLGDATPSGGGPDRYDGRSRQKAEPATETRDESPDIGTARVLKTRS